VDSEYVYHQGYTAALERGENGEDKTTLLKQARPAAPGTGGFKELLTTTGKITTLPMGKQALKNEALALENILLKQGSLDVADLGRRIPGLRRKVDRFSNMTETNWITRLYQDKFVISDGIVRLKRAAPSDGVRLKRAAPSILRGVKSAPPGVQPEAGRLPARQGKGLKALIGGRKAVEMLRQAAARPASEPIAVAPAPKKDKNYFLGLRAMYS
jgi:hypothetical protein